MDDYDGGWSRYNQQLGDAQDRALTEIAADVAAGRLTPEAAAQEEAATRAFVSDNFTFHAGAQPLDRAVVFGRE